MSDSIVAGEFGELTPQDTGQPSKRDVSQTDDFFSGIQTLIGLNLFSWVVGS